MNEIKALSVVDGRYKKLTEPLREIFSEYGLIKHRVFVEVQWLKFLLKELMLSDISEIEIAKIDTIVERFDENAAIEIKQIEKKTNHDVKAVEYYIKDRLAELGLAEVKEWVHFACTSEDINNTSYALMLARGKQRISETITDVLSKLESLGDRYKSVPMMSRTHGQPASPTTVGKEFINFAWRIRTELTAFDTLKSQAKMNGATGNLNAHDFVFPDIDWIAASQKFIAQYLQVEPLMFTTQINPYNYISEILHRMIKIAAITIDLDRDMWGYISLGYFKQKIKEGEVGSSTMPHKVNPIDFENSEGNMGVAISMAQHIAVKLLNSRYQRDLTDSTVLRNLGAVFGYFLIGLKNALKGLEKVEVDVAMIANDLSENMELLAEPIQTAMRVFGEENPYEKLKALTRGKKITRESLTVFIDQLDKVPTDVKEKMKELTVEKYTGLAEKLVDVYLRNRCM